MSWMQPTVPKTNLARYRQLSPNAGVHVSPIQLGAMSIGDKWDKLGEMSKESSFKLLDAYFDNGGNFIDTASYYQDGSSEEFIGEWAEKRGNRDQLFIATKYSSGIGNSTDPSIQQKILYGGNNAKAMCIGIEYSLKRLRTNYIDLYYLHYWDWETSIEEVMRYMNVLVQQGKVLYLGVSDTPAWIVAKANAYARQHGLTPFSVYQGAWNILERSFEREIIPMARAEGLALAPWAVLAGGKIRTDEEEEKRRKTGENGRTMLEPDWERNEQEKKVCKALEKVAAEVGAKHITAIAIAYLMHKTTHIFPIIGGRKVEQLLANLEALEISLNSEQMGYLDSIADFSPGFPNSLIGNGTAYWGFMLMNGHIDKQPYAEPIRPQLRSAQEGKDN